MKSPVLTIDFFHDTVCGWCFVMSPKLRKLAAEFPIRVRHRTFVLQDSPAKLAAAFGSAERAKSAILGHWERCAEHDKGSRINVEGMRRQRFPYPTGLLSAKACKAAELQTGDAGHWDYFDAVQAAHLTENRNIADEGVLLDAARSCGLDAGRLRKDMHSAEVTQLVSQDRQLAASWRISAVPTLAVSGGKWQLRHGSLAQMRAELALAVTDVAAQAPAGKNLR
ncbi:DsbA family oxidoreductase [Leisingera sp. NJS204]|uniref:DsbA family oxidoreductase n=1 Tax=Leisingera sp. NJS204 TaxID=2508307 RepID=UPI001010F833|nr:DsbA family protein [Leisingera sp. NJS204]QAX31615.1 DsbA family protein [Leisingera sp. NJS204]